MLLSRLCMREKKGVIELNRIYLLFLLNFDYTCCWISCSNMMIVNKTSRWWAIAMVVRLWIISLRIAELPVDESYPISSSIPCRLCLYLNDWVVHNGYIRPIDGCRVDFSCAILKQLSIWLDRQGTFPKQLWIIFIKGTMSDMGKRNTSSQTAVAN